MNTPHPKSARARSANPVTGSPARTSIAASLVTVVLITTLATTVALLVTAHAAGAQPAPDSLRALILARRVAAAGGTPVVAAKPVAPAKAAEKPVVAKPVVAKPVVTKPVAAKPAPVKAVKVADKPVAKAPAMVVADVAFHAAGPVVADTAPVVHVVKDTARVVRDSVVTAPVAPTAPAPVVHAPVAPAPAPVAPAPVVPAPVVAPAILSNATISGLLQAWYSAGAPGVAQSFRIRRAEIKLSGKAATRVSYTLMLDIAKSLSTSNSYTTVNGVRVLADESVNQATRMMQDAFVSITVSPRMAVDVGQFRIPLSLEGTTSAAKLDAVERALFLSDKSRNAGYGDARDIGVMARGTLAKRMDYWVGLFNGVGETQNATDRNEQKISIARFVVRPGTPGLQLGASTAWSGKPHADAPRRDRAGVEMQLTRGRLLLRSEGMLGADADTHRAGGYVHAGWKVRKPLELFARGDVWDPNTAREDALSSALGRDMIAGLNWWMAGTAASSTKIQVEGVQRSYARHLAPGMRQLLVNVQAAW